MEYDKPFLTYEQQISLLKERGLIIENHEFAIHALSTVSYYDLVNRYKRYFMNGNKFNDNISIGLLYYFFLLDKSVQAVIIKYSLLIENLFKTKLSYVVAEDFGVALDNYLNATYYKSSIKKLTFSAIHKNIMYSIESPSLSNPTRHYKIHHNHIPPWILFKNISFSNSINLLKLLRKEQAVKVVNSLLPTPALPFEQKLNFIYCSLTGIRKFRNMAAHNLDFTSFRLDSKRKIPHLLLYQLLGNTLVKKNSKTDKKATSGLYGILLSMLVYLSTPYLRANIINDLLSPLHGIYDGESSIRYSLYNVYATITGMPTDLLYRLHSYLDLMLVENKKYWLSNKHIMTEFPK